MFAEYFEYFRIVHDVENDEILSKTVDNSSVHEYNICVNILTEGFLCV